MLCRKHTQEKPPETRLILSVSTVAALVASSAFVHLVSFMCLHAMLTTFPPHREDIKPEFQSQRALKPRPKSLQASKSQPDASRRPLSALIRVLRCSGDALKGFRWKRALGRSDLALCRLLGFRDLGLSG